MDASVYQGKVVSLLENYMDARSTVPQLLRNPKQSPQWINAIGTLVDEGEGLGLVRMPAIQAYHRFKDYKDRNLQEAHPSPERIDRAVDLGDQVLNLLLEGLESNAA